MLFRKPFNIVDIDDPAFLAIESTLVLCFEDFKSKRKQASFEDYKKKLARTNFSYIFDKYPVAASILEQNQQKRSNLMSYVSEKIEQDHLHFKSIFSIDSSSFHRDNIVTGIGDFHNGMSTTIINFNNNQKILFKPTGSGISEAFFLFLDWANLYYNLGDYRYQISSNNTYHWLEFIDQVPCNFSCLCTYYERAGFILGVLYLLNSVDFHYENVIAKGSTPVLIDHETIIQPQIDPAIRKFFKKFISKKIGDTVLSTMLLPIHDASIMPVGICGYGYHAQKSIQVVKKEPVDRFTDNWRFVNKFAEESFQKENLPVYNGRAFYPSDYIDNFLEGFENAYRLFMEYRDFLLESEISPLLNFKNQTIRFIWRPTNVYAKIFNQMNLPKNLISYEHYEQKIKNYLGVAFKNVPGDSDLRLIHQHEIAHMLNGDVPFFEVNSSSRDLETDFGVLKNFFKHSAVENIERKLKKLSLEDLEYQKKLIIESHK